MYYNSINLNKETDIKAFWETINSFLSKKGTNVNKFSPVDNEKYDEYLCKTFSNFY